MTRSRTETAARRDSASQVADRWTLDWQQSTDRDALGADPITWAPFQDPCVASDGRTYERSTLEELFKAPDARSPYTREPLDRMAYRHLGARRALGLKPLPKTEATVVDLHPQGRAWLDAVAALVVESEGTAAARDGVRRRAASRGETSEEREARHERESEENERWMGRGMMGGFALGAYGGIGAGIAIGAVVLSSGAAAVLLAFAGLAVAPPFTALGGVVGGNVARRGVRQLGRARRAVTAPVRRAWRRHLEQFRADD